MNAVAFDTYRVVKRLKEAGFSETQAEAVTIAIQDSTMLDLSHLVTREHFDEKSRQTDARLDSLESRLDSLEKRLDATKAELDARIDAVESRLLTKIADTKIQLELRMSEMEARLIAAITQSKLDTYSVMFKMILSAITINVAAMIGLIKLLGH